MDDPKGSGKTGVKNVLFLMTVLLLVISVISTYLITNFVLTIPEQPVRASGEVKLVINNPNYQKAQGPDLEGGIILLEVLPSKET